MLMLDKMEELNMTQKQLAELMGCSQQYVSKVLKGQENLSLETLSKIEDCLEISILQEELELA
jgi:transcriptional regulator with XRE-family HTH domain